MAETPRPNRKRTPSSSSLRWGILRDTFLHRASPSSQSDRISRKATQGGFNLIRCRHLEDDNSKKCDDVCVSYTLPIEGAPTLVLRQRLDKAVSIKDFRICNDYDIDNTGLVCQWPSEDVLAYFCLSHADMFRSKRILELGAGYGFAGLAIAASTDALEVVISDGNPQVVDYIQHNIDANSGAFRGTMVKSMILHWNQEDVSDVVNTYDIIVASDCTFFKEFHEGLARTVKSLLKPSEGSEAMFFCPKRGNSLDMFVEKIKEVGLKFSITENYDNEVWHRHQNFLNGNRSWVNYEMEHCYPLLVRITP